MSQPFRPILPWPEVAPVEDLVAARNDEHKIRRRAPLVNAACENCRRAKVRCDGERPQCSRCKKRNKGCEYIRGPLDSPAKALKRKLDDFQTRATVHEELFDMLQARPEGESREIWRRIRSGASAEDILHTLRDGNLLLQLSLLPEARRRYDFAFSVDMPKSFLELENPYLKSPIYQWNYSDASNRPEMAQDLVVNEEREPRLGFRADQGDQYLKPYFAARIVENYLDSLEPSSWTQVSKDDRLMRKLLQLYFQNEHQWFFFLHKELFLEDMACKRPDLCSSLLVNAILAYACHCHPGLLHRAEYWNPQNLAYQFLAESKRLWDLERGKLRLTTVQAAMVLSVVHNACGADKIGTEYTMQAVQMARELKLLDADSNDGETANEHRDDNAINTSYSIARNLTAWALFIWTVQNSLGFCRSPLIEQPPKAPLPQPSLNPKWYGETWVKYPASQDLVPTHYAEYFRARAMFYVIVLDFCKLSFGRDGGLLRLSIVHAREIYERLLQWHTGLVPSLKAESIVFPVHLKLHMHYHNIIMMLFERCDTLESPHNSLADSSLPKEVLESAAQIVSRSRRYLQTLIHVYYLRHSFDAIDTFMIHFLSNAAFISINICGSDDNLPPSTRDELQSMALLYTKGLHEQGKHFYLARVIFQIVKDRLSPENLEKLKHYVKIEDSNFEEERIRAEEVQSEWPVSVMSMDKDVDALRLDRLLESYSKVSLES